VRTLALSDEERALMKPLCLITAKPAMFVGNVSEDGFENNPFLARLQEYAKGQNAPVVAICAKIEADMSESKATLPLTVPRSNQVVCKGFTPMSEWYCHRIRS